MRRERLAAHFDVNLFDLSREGIADVARDAGLLFQGRFDFGYCRFDGVRFVRWEAVGRAHAQKSVRALLVSRDGAVWAGFGDSGACFMRSCSSAALIRQASSSSPDVN